VRDPRPDLPRLAHRIRSAHARAVRARVRIEDRLSICRDYGDFAGALVCCARLDTLAARVKCLALFVRALNVAETRRACACLMESVR
jgi:hypothetical protein